MAKDQATELFVQDPLPVSDKSVEGKPDAPKSDDSTQATLAVLVGEGRKYKTVEELVKGYLKADEFIEVLKNDNAKLKQEVVKGKTLDEVLERVERGNKQTPVTTGGAGAFSAEDIARLVDERMTGRETARSRDDNVRKAEAALAARYGEKAKDVFFTRADTPQKRAALNNLAAVDPDMFAALFSTPAIVGNPADSTTKAADRFNAAVTGSRAADPDTREFYDGMRKKEPSKYYSTAVQLEMHKKLAANPEKFLGRKVG